MKKDIIINTFAKLKDYDYLEEDCIKCRMSKSGEFCC